MGYELEAMLEKSKNGGLTGGELEKTFNLILNAPYAGKGCEATSSCNEEAIEIDGRYRCKMHSFYGFIKNNLK
ncbi:MAG: hypothetical protein AABW57_02425 [Nanoarchaeota archaeon]